MDDKIILKLIKSPSYEDFLVGVAYLMNKEERDIIKFFNVHGDKDLNWAERAANKTIITNSSKTEIDNHVKGDFRLFHGTSRTLYPLKILGEKYGSLNTINYE